MKRSTIAAFIALLMVFIYIFTTGNKFNIYEKKVFYKTPEEAIYSFIGFINVQENIKGKEGYYSNEVPKEFLESLSKRYRLYTQNAKRERYIYNSLPCIENYDMREVKDDIESLNSTYEDTFKEIKGYEKAKDIRLFRIDGKGYSYESINREDVNEDGTVKVKFNNENYKGNYDENKFVTVELVVIDEGEGYVVDYYNVYY